MRGFGSVCSGCRGLGSRIGGLRWGLWMGGGGLRGRLLLLALLLRGPLLLWRHWRVVRVVALDDALRSHLSRPMHAVWFAEDAGPRDLAANLLLSIFEVERLVGMPVDVSCASPCSSLDIYSSISPIHHLVQRQPRPVYRRCPPPYWQTQKDNNHPERKYNESSQSDALWLLRGRLLFLGRRVYGVCRRICRIPNPINILDSSFGISSSWSC